MSHFKTMNIAKVVFQPATTMENQKNVLDMFKVNNKDTRSTSLMSFWCL